jgi:hypothetical protein
MKEALLAKATRVVINAAMTNDQEHDDEHHRI